jgi:NAD(P)-dependent dehydrogenase (short-subunit alcohol dehydrogenase family)
MNWDLALNLILQGLFIGIGNGIAELFSEEGAKVALCDINAEGVNTAAAYISEKTGRKTLPITLDITKKNGVNKAVAKVVKEFGTVDILVNTAGIIRLAHAVDLSEKDWDDTFAVNVKGALFFCQAAGKVMMQHQSGKLVNIASDSGKRPFPAGEWPRHLFPPWLSCLSR